MNETTQPGSPFQDAPKPFKVDPLAKARAVRAANVAARKEEEARAAAPIAPSVEPEAAGAPAADTSALPRRARKPFGTPEAKLSWPPRAGYKRRWFNDKPGRIARALAAGYEHVTDGGKPVSLVVDPGEGGKGLDGYLMEIPEEWFDEDFAVKQEALDLVDADIYRGAHKAEEAKGDHRYVPSTGIKVSVSRGRR